MDSDANQLARTHIDEVERLLSSNSRLHVNEIDSLLSEINDFIHLRSRELSKGEKVNYREVLEAIDECGSPSEIVKQYLEINTNEINEPFKPIKEKSSSFFSKKRIGLYIPSKMAKSPKDKESESVFETNSNPSDLLQKEKNDNIRFRTHSYYKKYEYKKKFEKWIFLSCISIIGIIWIPFLALYWLISLRSVESKFMKSWRENKTFTSVFPYQPEFRTLFTLNQTYQTNLLRINRVKTLFMLFLIIPFYGYVIPLFAIGFISLFSFGMAPLLAYYIIKGPKRHINILIEREYQIKSEESNNHNYLAFYNRSGYLSFDFDITTKIMRELNLNKNEIIFGMYQSGIKILGPSFIIITNQHLINYTPSIMLAYEDRIRYLPKKQVISYHFRKKRRLTLIVESVDGRFFIIGGLDKKVLEPLQNSLNLLELKHKKAETVRLVQKKERRNKTTRGEPFVCQVCESQRSSTIPNLECDTCSRYVCIDCYCQMAHEGRTSCPKCEGSLVSQ